jgi:transcription antitermination protein NusB
MQGIRRQGRSFALQLLYQVELSQQTDSESLGRFWMEVDASTKTRKFAEELVEATLKHQVEIDKRLTANLEHWKLGRLSVVVRNVLRLAVCEMLMLRQTPHAVVINEAVDLTRAFMDEESAPFVNKVLEKCWRADPQKIAAASAAELSSAANPEKAPAKAAKSGSRKRSKPKSA